MILGLDDLGSGGAGLGALAARKPGYQESLAESLGPARRQNQLAVMS
jgi:hypothetical protein